MDITHLARFRLSSYKEEFGLDQLLNPDTNLYWQSDGEFPHFIEAQFSKLVKIDRVEFFCAGKSDTSYAPQEIRVLAGFGPFDLLQVKRIELTEDESMENTWVPIDLSNLGGEGLECTVLRFNIEMNWFHGKDSHLRGFRIYAKQQENKINLSG